MSLAGFDRRVITRGLQMKTYQFYGRPAEVIFSSLDQAMEFASTKMLSKSLDFDCDHDNSKFLFKNRKFLSIDRGLSSTSSSQYSGDSDSYSVDWGSFSEDDESEVPNTLGITYQLLCCL